MYLQKLEARKGRGNGGFVEKTREGRGYVGEQEKKNKTGFDESELK